jgi:PAS domain S-box-containing protein
MPLTNFITTLFSADDFMPHGHCYLWHKDILWLNVVSDVIIALAYFAIPFALFYLVRKRKDLHFNWIFIMFATFIVACGTTHILEIVTVWHPIYGVQGLVKFVTASTSVATAIALWFLMPKAISLPGPSDLEQKNRELRALNLRLLQSSDSKLRQVIESAPAGLIMVDKKGEIVLCNAQIESLFGYRREELLGKRIEMLIPERFREDHPNHRNMYFAIPETRQMGAGRDLTGLRKDGIEFPVEIGLNPVQTEEGSFVLASIVDITERKKFARDLSVAKEAAEAANSAKSSFLANMSHEIRTPLGAVLGFSELIIDPQIRPSEKANFVAAIRRNGELLSSIINDILDLSKIEAGKMEITTQEIALIEILTDTKTLLDLQANEKGIYLKVMVDHGVPEVITTDPLRLRQILINIIGNAIKFTAKGGVEVRIQVEPRENSRAQLKFVITDSGPGISADQVEKLFAPFSQADSTTKRKYGGTGLGLVLSKRFASLLGGDVSLTESKLNQGSTFTVTIDPGPLHPPSSGSSSIGPAKKFRGGALPLDGVRVLLAEDFADNQIIISQILKLAGAKVDLAMNGKEAVETAMQGQYHIVLMDLQMPIMDGFEATVELRRRGYIGKIIALTAHTLSDEKERCMKSGFNDHVGKPVNRASLIERIVQVAEL